MGARRRCWPPLYRRVRPLVRRIYKAAFPRGVDNSSNGYGNQVAVSLPTRWATVVASGYMGADLRFFFGGETLSNYTQTLGLTNLANGFSVDRLFDRSLWNQCGRTSRRCPAESGARLRRIYSGSGSRSRAGSMPTQRAGMRAGRPTSEYGLDAANANDFRYAKDIGASGGGPIKDESKPSLCSIR